MNTLQPTESELEILQVLWEHQPTTIRFVHEQVSQQREVGYTTVLKQMQRMTEKEMVERYKEGKTHFYKALIKESEVKQSMFKRLLNTAFKGSAIDLAMHALGQSKTSAEELEALENWLKEQKGNQHE